MEITERHLLARRAEELERAQRAAGRVLTAGCAFTFLLALGLTGLLARALHRQQLGARQLGLLNDSLVAEISERRTAEESLRASEAGFRHLAEDSLDLICRHAPDGTLTYVSSAARPILGYSPLEMVGVHFQRFLVEPPKTETKIEAETGAKTQAKAEAASRQRFGALLQQTHRKPLLQRFRTAKGDEIWLETVGHSIVDPDSGEVRAWHTTSRDVSARVRDERARARLLEGLRAVVEIADELIAAPNEEALLQRAVQGARARLGLGRCAIYLTQTNGPNPHKDGLMRGTWGTDEAGRAVREDELFFDTRTDPNADDIKPGVGERWVVRQNQVRHLWREGRRIELPGKGWIARTLIATHHDVIGLFFHDAAPGEAPHDAVQQELVAVFCSLLGALLESARAQTHVSAQRQLLETVVENAPIFLYSVDKNERFTLATGSALERIGMDRDEMIGRDITQVLGDNPTSMREMRRALGGETTEEEIAYAGRWLKMWRQPLREASGEISGMIGLGMDITDQHHAQTALRASEARYRQVADSLQEVLFQTDAHGNWSLLNPAWTEITGFEIEAIAGHARRRTRSTQMTAPRLRRC